MTHKVTIPNEPSDWPIKIYNSYHIANSFKIYEMEVETKPIKSEDIKIEIKLEKNFEPEIALYEDLLTVGQYDEEGAECTMEGYEELKETEEWRDLGHSMNFEVRWAFMARIAVINIIDPRVTAAICADIAEWGKEAENRKKFGKFLDNVKNLTELGDDRRNTLEIFLIENCADLVEKAKNMLTDECIIIDNAFLANDDEKAIFDSMFSKTQGVNWDAISVLQTKPQEFIDSLARRDKQLFQRSCDLLEELIATAEFKILTPGKLSLDFISHMATHFHWQNGTIRNRLLIVNMFVHECI